jgi:hypothetical protein
MAHGQRHWFLLQFVTKTNRFKTQVTLAVETLTAFYGTSKVHYRVFRKTLITAVEWLVFLLRFREVPGSNLGPETCYPEVHGDPLTLKSNSGVVP